MFGGWRWFGWIEMVRGGGGIFGEGSGGEETGQGFGCSGGWLKGGGVCVCVQGLLRVFGEGV